MYPYNKTRNRPPASTKYMFGPTFSLQASASPVVERAKQTPDFRLTKDTGAIKSGELLTSQGQVSNKTYNQYQIQADRQSGSPYASSIRSQPTNRRISASSTTDLDRDDDFRERNTHSANLNNRAKQSPVYLPGDRVIFTENPAQPGVPIVYRSGEERAANPDRLNLDRRRLTICPILEGEEQLRLLNYQHNTITRIQHLSTLKRLIFLDLYDNQIEEITGLDSLKSLRVLMLGKNRIKRIQGLEQLVKLDVLDLHGNHITDIEQLSHLSELRVLNLAGNGITHVQNLTGLDSLAELNLRRNRIATVTEIELLPSLQRLFLSFNEITCFSDISCIGDSPSLSEISLDGNPFAQEQFYKQTVLRHMQQLRQLDMKRISDEERRIALVMARREDEKRKEFTKAAVIKEKRRLAIDNAKKQWEVMQGSLMNRSSKVVKMPEIYASHVASYANGNAVESRVLTDDGDESESVERWIDAARDANRVLNRPMSASSVHNGSTQSTPRERRREKTMNKANRSRSESRTGLNRVPENDALKSRLADGDKADVSHLAELQGDVLNLYGVGSLDSLDRNWGVQAAGAVTTITFKFIPFAEISKNLHKIRSRFPSAVNLVFTSNGIDSFHQLNALASVRRLDSITIEPEGNSITQFVLWKPYLIFRLAHFPLRKINDVEVSPLDITNAERLFGPVNYITSKLPQSRLLKLLGESRKKQVMALFDDKARKTPEAKAAERGHETVGRGALQYHAATKAGSRAQEGSKAEVAKSYVSEWTQECILLDRKMNKLLEIWPSLFVELVQTAVVEMYDKQTYMKRCMEELESKA